MTALNLARVPMTANVVNHAIATLACRWSGWIIVDYARALVIPNDLACRLHLSTTDLEKVLTTAANHTKAPMNTANLARAPWTSSNLATAPMTIATTYPKLQQRPLKMLELLWSWLTSLKHWPTPWTFSYLWWTSSTLWELRHSSSSILTSYEFRWIWTKDHSKMVFPRNSSWSVKKYL